MSQELTEQEKIKIKLFLDHSIKAIASYIDDHQLLLDLLTDMSDFSLNTEIFAKKVEAHLNAIPNNIHKPDCQKAVKQLIIVRNEMLANDSPRAQATRSSAKSFFSERVADLMKEISESFHPSNEDEYDLTDEEELAKLLDRIHELLLFSIEKQYLLKFLTLLKDFDLTNDDYDRQYNTLKFTFNESHNYAKLSDVFSQYNGFRHSIYGTDPAHKKAQTFIIDYLEPFIGKLLAEQKLEAQEEESKERMMALLADINKYKDEEKTKTEEQKKAQRESLQQSHDLIVQQQKERKAQLEKEIEELRQNLQSRHDQQIEEQKKRRERKQKKAEKRQQKLQERHDKQIKEWKEEKQQIKQQMLAMQEEKKRAREELHKDHLKKKAQEKLITQQKIAERKNSQESQYQIRQTQKQEEFIKSQERIKAVLMEQERQRQLRLEQQRQNEEEDDDDDDY